MTIESVGGGRTCQHQCDLTCPTVPVCCGTGALEGAFPVSDQREDFPADNNLEGLPCWSSG